MSPSVDPEAGTEGGEAYLEFIPPESLHTWTFFQPVTYPDIPRYLVSVLVPRQRTIGVRLSEAEYQALERFCIESGTRSISDLARIAISTYLSRAAEESSLSLAVSQNAVQVKELEEKIARLSSEIAILRAGSLAGAGATERQTTEG